MHIPVYNPVVVAHLSHSQLVHTCTNNDSIFCPLQPEFVDVSGLWADNESSCQLNCGVLNRDNDRACEPLLCCDTKKTADPGMPGSECMCILSGREGFCLPSCGG